MKFASFLFCVAITLFQNSASATTVVMKRDKCEPDREEITLSQLEEAILAGQRTKAACNAQKLASWGRDAVPVVLRLLENGAPLSGKTALETIEIMGPEATPLIPTLLTLLRTAAVNEASKTSAHDGKYDASLTFDDIKRAIEGYGAAAESAMPQLLELHENNRLSDDTRNQVFQLIWRVSKHSKALRLQSVSFLLKTNNFTSTQASEIAKFLAAVERPNQSLANLLRPLIVSQHGQHFVEPYIVLDGAHSAIPYLLHIFSASEMGLKQAIRTSIHQLGGTQSLDPQLRRAAENSALLPTVVKLLGEPEKWPQTYAFLVQSLGSRATAGQAVQAFIDLKQDVREAHQPLIKLLVESPPTDRLWRDKLFSAIYATGAADQIPRNGLITEIRRELKFSQQQKLARDQNRPCKDTCQPVECWPARVWTRNASTTPVPFSDLQQLFLDAVRHEAPACAMPLAHGIGEFKTPEAMALLYEAFHSNRSLEQRETLFHILGKNPELVLPILKKSLHKLKLRQLMDAERYLVQYAAKDFVHDYRQQVLPALLGQPLRPDADQPVADRPEDDRSVIGIGPGMIQTSIAQTKGGVAVQRIATLAPMTPELLHHLLDIVAGPYVEAAEHALEVIAEASNADRSLRPAHYKSTKDRIIKTAPGAAQQRLQRLLGFSRFSPSERTRGLND